MPVAAIIGCGRVAPNHIQPYLDHPQVEIKWACDLNIAKARQLARQAGIPCCTENAQEVFADPQVDVVNILTDHASHYQLAKSALEQGKHVVVEKPFTLDGDEAQELLDLAARQQRYLICISQHRFDPAIDQVRQLITSGQLGKILLVNARLLCGRGTTYFTESYWHGIASLDGGSALINQGYHIFDILCSIFEPPVAINMLADRLEHQQIIETEDTLSLQMRFSNGALGTLNITSGLVSHDWDPDVEIIGSKGRACFDLRYPHQNFQIEIDGVDPADISQPHQEVAAPGISYYGDLHTAQLNDFIEAIVTGREVRFAPLQAVRTLRAILRAYDSAQQNGFQWGSVRRQ